MPNSASFNFYPVILAGGRGTRFWPLSRKRKAKQLLPLNSDKSMIQETVERLRPLASNKQFWVITNDDLREPIICQLKKLEKKQIVAEPIGRNTAPAIGLAAFLLARIDPTAVIGLFPSDHVILDEKRFCDDIRRAAELASQGANIVVIGIKPTRAETGYGYIEAGREAQKGVLQVKRFTEKPTANVAEQFVKAGNFFWNSGMFIWGARTLADALSEHLPKTAPLLKEIADSYGTRKFEKTFAKVYPKCENISVDYAVLEPRSAKGEAKSGIYCIPASFGWNDLGSWTALYEHRAGNKDGANVILANQSFTLNAAGNFIDVKDKFVAAVGVDNLVVVETDDALLITTREHSQDVGKVVKFLDEKEDEAAGLAREIYNESKGRMATQIKFGTDGWRGIIADDFTFDNVRRVGNAMATYVHNHEDASKGLVVGYDTRFVSKEAAQIVSEVIAASGIRVCLSDDYTPTPALSYAVKNLGTAGGVMITSSHNPFNWNGVKFKANYGGSGTPAIMKSIEGYLDAPRLERSGGSVTVTDFKTPYIAAIKNFVDLKLIQQAKFKFAVDVMYGAGRGVLKGIFSESGIDHLEIRGELNPLFPGINPEPILPHLAMLQKVVVQERCEAGLATDGDADRLGAVAEDGSFVDAHKCFAVILEWLLKRKQWPGEIVRAFNTTRMLDRIAAKYGRKINECGIGFKYICDLMLERDILIGGEESGGIGIRRHLPERDGILNSLLLANIMAEEGKPLGQLVRDLQQEYGEHHYGRLDLHLTNEVKDDAMRRAGEKPAKMGSFNVQKVETLDGVKFFLDAPTNGNGAEAWVLVRASGTEPLLRIYSEAASPELVSQILKETEEFVHAGSVSQTPVTAG